MCMYTTMNGGELHGMVSGKKSTCAVSWLNLSCSLFYYMYTQQNFLTLSVDRLAWLSVDINADLFPD